MGKEMQPQVCENSFQKFHAFLDLLKDAGLVNFSPWHYSLCICNDGLLRNVSSFRCFHSLYLACNIGCFLNEVLKKCKMVNLLW